MKVAVIGAGISGLTTAFLLKANRVDVTVFESDKAVGGNIQTETRGGFVLEYGPNSILANRDVFELILGLGLMDQIAAPKPSAKARYIVRNGRLTLLPSGISGVVSTKALSASAKFRLLREPFIRSKSTDGESVYSFFERRFGSETADFVVDPFVSGIYAGDPRKLSVRNAFPRLHDLERTYNSFIRGAVFSRNKSEAKVPKGFPRSFTFNGGMSTLTRTLSDKLDGHIVLGAHVTAIEKVRNEYLLNAETKVGPFDAVVISTPSRAAGRLVAGLDMELSQRLADVYYPPIAVVMTGFDVTQIPDPPAGFGVLIPAVEKRQTLGTLFNSSAFENRAPAGSHLFTTFIGGSRSPELCDLSDPELRRIALDELNRLFEIRGEPVLAEVKRWESSIPQYNIGYESLGKAIDSFRLENPGIFFCSNFYNGISVGDCIKNGNLTSRDVLEFITH